MRFFHLTRSGRAGINFGPLILVAITVLIGASIHGCSKKEPAPVVAGDIDQFLFERTGEDFLINALDELGSIAEWAIQNAPDGLPPAGQKAVLSQTASDTVYVYGEIIAGGYGAVVTERHTFPKGLLLITVRKTYGKEGGRIVSDTKRYISYQSFLDDEPQQSSLTELYGLSSDTIVTRVLRNGILETFTFRLPVITRTTNPVDGSVRITSRYGSAGRIISETTDGGGAMIKVRQNYGDSTGALVTRTDYPDSTWRTVLSLGQSDGSVFREITTGP